MNDEVIQAAAPTTNYWQVDIRGEGVEQSLTLPGYLHGLAVVVFMQGMAATGLSKEESREPLSAMRTTTKDGVLTCVSESVTITAAMMAAPTEH